MSVIKFKEIPFAKKYIVSTEGVVKKALTDEVVKPSKESNIYYLTKNSGVIAGYPLHLILAKTFLPIEDKERENFYRVWFKDGNKDNCALSNLEWKYMGDYKKATRELELKQMREKFNYPDFVLINGNQALPFKVECEFKKEYYYIPFSEHCLLINKEGVIYNPVLDNYVTIYDDDYKSIKFRKEGKYITTPLHRLVAMTFIPIPERLKDIPLERLEVNHINGDKKDNRVENLEWVTTSENNRHAIVTGLTNHEAVYAKNILTREIRKFNCVSDCAKCFDISDKKLRRHIRSERAGKLTRNWHVFIGEGKVFPVLKESEIEMNSWDVCYGIWVGLNRVTGQKVLANTKIELLDAVGARIEDCQYRNKLNYVYMDWDLYYDEDPLRHNTEAVKNRNRNEGIYDPQEIQILDTVTNEIKHYSSVRKAAMDLNIAENTFRYRLKNGKDSDTLIKNRYRVVA